MRHRFLRRIALAGALLSLATPAFAQNNQAPIPVTQMDPGILGQPGFRFAEGLPDGMNLIPNGAGARNGRVWFGNTGLSIRIVGEVYGAAPDWPKGKDSILSKDHVEVWLAANADVDLPPAVWPQGDGAMSPDECRGYGSNAQTCTDWFETQDQDYRPVFKKLFVRQWLLANDISEESYATPAYAVVATKYKPDGLAALKPHGDVQFRWQLRAGKPGYLFEIDIPYSAFPPLNTQQTAEMRLMVDVFSSAPAGKKEGAFSTTSSVRAYGKPGSFNSLQFNPPLPFEITPCISKLEAKITEFSPTHPEWFIPSADPGGYEADAFLLENRVGPNGEPPDVSPSVFPIHNFWRSLGPSEWVCGPNLAYRNGSAVRDFGMDVLLFDANRDVSVSEDGFAARKEPDGTVLIKVGPRVWNVGSMSQCGACDRTDFKIFALDENLNLITILDLNDVVDSPHLDSQDFTVSPDWSQVVEYNQTEDPASGDQKWSSVSYCLASGMYTECGRKDNVKPPDPPLIRQLLEQ
jgi:hypothetical protein